MKRRKNPWFWITVLLCLLMSGCSLRPAAAHEEEPMIGYINAMNQEEQTIVFDISEWMKRDDAGSAMNDWGAEYEARVLPGMRLVNEAGDELTWKDLRLGQKVRIHASESRKRADAPDELVILDMTEQEIYKRLGLLASKRGQHRTIVMFEQGAELPYDSGYMEREAPGVFEGGVSWLEYDPNYVVDMKRTLDIRSLPIFLVFDDEKLVVKTGRLENVTAFLSSVQED